MNIDSGSIRPDETKGEAPRLRAVFVFTHAMLARVWDDAVARLAEAGVSARVVTQMTSADWETFATEEVATADVAYLDLSRSLGGFDALIAAARGARLALPGGIEAEGAWTGDFDRDALARIRAYLKTGRAEDYANGVLDLLHRAGCVAAAPPPPSAPVLFGIRHPDAGRIWADAAEYLAWADARLGGGRDAVPVIFDRNGWLNGDTATADCCIRHLEAAGLLPVPMFCDWELAEAFGAPAHPLRRMIDGCGGRVVAIWNAAVVHGKDTGDPAGPFAAHGVPVFQLLRNWTASAEEWRASPEGLSGMTVTFGLTRPEMIGCADPTVAACSRPSVEGGGFERRTADPLDDQVARLAGRTRRWAGLRRTPNADKRVALLLHNPPCKGLEATIGSAAGLDALQAAVDLMHRLADEGYRVENLPTDGKALLELILARKAVSEFRWTNVEEIVAKGGALAEIDEAAYRADFDRLPEDVRDAVDAAWGAFPAKSMVRDPNGEKPTLVVSGLRFGNLLVMTDPKRGCWGARCDGEVCRILHDPTIAPPHHWLATWWFLQREADAVVAIGTDGPLEYLPGKRAGLSERCFPNISLGDLPLVYPYVMNSVGEGMLAKRRGRAVLVDHLSAPVARADALGGRWDALEDLHRQVLHAAAGARREELEAELRRELTALGLLADGPEAFSRAIEELPRRIAALRRRVLCVGHHRLGHAPDAETAALYLAEARGSENRGVDEAALLAGLAGCDEEIEAVVRALSGGFVPPGPGGHLSRGKVDALPTGRNFYGVDLSRIPTPAASVVGARMGAKLLDAYLADEGRFPETIGVTLWSSDAFQADGELTAQVLWLMGCTARRDAAGKVVGVAVEPLESLVHARADGEVAPRPRIDVVVQMSGIVRDSLPGVYALLDKAVTAVAERDEPDDRNFVRAHVRARMAELRAVLDGVEDASLKRLASYRCFSAADGGYGGGVELAIDASAWEDDADLAEALVNTSGTAFGADGRAARVPPGRQMAEYAHLLGRMDLSYQRAGSAEADVLSCGTLGVQGGNAAAKRALGNGGLRLYWGDTHATADGEVRSTADEIAQALAVSILNPDWIGAARARGYAGASEVSDRVNRLFGWSAAARAVQRHQFDAVHDALVTNAETREWLREANPYALEEITRRLLEAEARGLWAADARRLDELHGAVLALEGDIEEAMGSVSGEFQGAAVDVRTRGQVKEWAYAYRAK